MNQDKEQQLIEASLLALGAIIATWEHPQVNPVAYNLARALKLNGVESAYIEGVLSQGESKSEEN